MKKTRFLFALLMAIVMIAMSPMRAWAQEADPRMAVFNKLEGVTATFEDEVDYPWGLTKYNGLDVLMNTNQGKDGTTSTTTIKLACDQTIRIHFNYKTSSEASGDYLKISVDGNEVVNSQYAEPDEDGIATVVGTYSSLLPANANGHTITMSYIKDISFSSGDDCGCIYFISAYTHQHYYNATSCDWSEDNTSATLHLKCECGETADVEATTITRTEEAPTCVKDGFCTITASAAYNGKTVTYSKTETFAALGHDWQVQSDGTYACQREGCTALSIEIIESSGGFEGEGPENLFDGDPTTKWCGSGVENGSNSFYVKFKPGKPSVLVSYSLVDAKDTEGYYNRGWSSWEIQGSNDPNSEEWESISYNGGDYQGRTFTTGNTTAYTYYMITFSVNGSEYGEYYLQQMADMNITWSCAHDFTSKTLTTEPVADGLYAYACDRGCGAHSDDHIVKASEGESTTAIALTPNTAGGTTTYTAADVTLEDGKAFSTPVEFTAPSDKVTVDRTFTANKPASQMLPFTVPASQISGATFFEFGGVSFNETTQKWEATMTAVTTGDLEAYKPYMVVPAAASITFNNGTSPQAATFPVTPSSANDMKQSATGWTFIALNAAKAWATGDADLGRAYGFAAAGHDGFEAGQFVKVDAGASAAPGRCYLLKDNADPLTRAGEELPATIGIRFVVGSTTGIGTLDTETGAFTFDGWYDLQGNRVSEPKQGGVMIKNNKKVMVK